MPLKKNVTKGVLLFVGFFNFKVPNQHSNTPSTQESRQKSAESEKPNPNHFKIFRLTTNEVKTIGKDPITFGFPLKEATVQFLPNHPSFAAVCKPEILNSIDMLCDSGDALISFVKNSDPGSLIPRRGECFCVSQNLINNVDSPNYMFSVVMPTPDEYNVFSGEAFETFSLKTPEGISVAKTPTSIYSRIHSDTNSDFNQIKRFEYQSGLARPTQDPSYQLVPNYDTHIDATRRIVKSFYEDSLQSQEWNDYKTGNPKDPFPVGIDSSDFKKQSVFNDYIKKSVGSLGSNHSAWGIFYNGWKLARLTRDKNSFTLEKINEAVKHELEKRIKDPKVVLKLAPKFFAINEYLWHEINAAAKSSSTKDPSKAIDQEFLSALEGKKHSGLWKTFFELENAVLEHQTNSSELNNNQISLSEANEIESEAPLTDLAQSPSTKMCRRDFTSPAFSRSSCPCKPKSALVPCNLELPSLKSDFVQRGVKYGLGKTYYLVDETQLPVGLRSSSFVARRTGYSTPNNSPKFTNQAGFAAVARRNGGKDGRAVLGAGTLDSPITAAISPAAAANFGICQGDMIHDPDYGWLRVEGGCTSGGLGNRVDVWRGNASTRSLQIDSFLNSDRKFKHFPAGLVDANYAAENPK